MFLFCSHLVKDVVALIHCDRERTQKPIANRPVGPPARWEIAAMSRFYFHVRSGENIMSDDEGTECADVNAAREEALATARDVLADAIRSSKNETPDCFIIADANGRELMTVPFNEALPAHLRTA